MRLRFCRCLAFVVAFVFAVILNAVKDPEEPNPQQPFGSFSQYIPPTFCFSLCLGLSGGL
jgi:hypothetical protein